MSILSLDGKTETRGVGTNSRVTNIDVWTEGQE